MRRRPRQTRARSRSAERSIDRPRGTVRERSAPSGRSRERIASAAKIRRLRAHNAIEGGSDLRDAAGVLGHDAFFGRGLRSERPGQEALARYSSMASEGIWAMPFTMTKRILRSWTSRRSSFVGRPSWRAACVARRSSAVTVVSLVETKLTAERGGLVLHLGEHREMIAVGEHISGVLEGCQQLERFLQGIGNGVRRLHQLNAICVDDRGQ